MTTMEARSKMVPSFRVLEIAAKVAQAAKIARKLGLELPTMTDTGKREIRGYRVSGLTGGTISCPLFGAEWKVEFSEITIQGDAPVLMGWKFIAAIEHLATGTIVTSREGEATIPASYRERASVCEHCHTRRQRNMTFVVLRVGVDAIVLNSDGASALAPAGTMLQVGSSCVRDFLGHADPKSILDLMGLLHDLDTCEEREEGFAGRAPHVFTLVDVLERTALEIDTNGWLSKGNADEFSGRLPTAVRVENSYGKGAQAPVPTPAHTARAEAARTWALSLASKENRSDYEHNVLTIAQAESITTRHFGLACSILSSYEREQARIIESGKAIKGEHFGTIKKRENFVLTVERVIDLDSEYGTTHLHLFQDAEGRRAKWFASSERLDVGTTYTLKGTVKAHETYKDVPVTMLSRCKVVA
jgi:hypothetical protein